MEKQLNEINIKLASIDERLEIQGSQLEYHIRRTDILEEKVAKHSGFVDFIKWSVTTVLAAFSALASLWRALQ